MQILRPHSCLAQKLVGGGLECSHLCFNKSSRWFWCTSEFDIHWFKWTEIYWWNLQSFLQASSRSSFSDLCAIHSFQPLTTHSHCHCDHTASPVLYILVPSYHGQRPCWKEGKEREGEGGAYPWYRTRQDSQVINHPHSTDGKCQLPKD